MKIDLNTSLKNNIHENSLTKIMKLKRIEDAIEVVEWAIDHRQSMLKDNNLYLNEIHQLRQGKAYLELITDMLYGTSELLEMDQEIAED